MLAVPATLQFEIGKSTAVEGWYYAQTKLGSWEIYRCCQLRFPVALLQPGENTVSLRMVKVGGKGGIMYDTVKLEIE